MAQEKTGRQRDESSGPKLRHKTGCTTGWPLRPSTRASSKGEDSLGSGEVILCLHAKAIES